MTGAGQPLESIGRFSRRSGVPISHLRHYHQVGLLEPAYIDPESGYRYYAAAQTESAEVIAILRSVDMPVRDIQRLLAEPSEANVQELLTKHRNRLEDRLTQVARRLESIDRIVKEGTLVKKRDETPRDRLIPVRVKEVTSEVPSLERWAELRVRAIPALPTEPQEMHTVTLTSDDGRDVALLVGSFEGYALKLQIAGIKTERPLTYDLMLEAFARHDVRVVRADVVRVAHSTFFAELTTDSGSRTQTFDCRPSDALNLALRAGAPICVAPQVFDDAIAQDLP